MAQQHGLMNFKVSLEFAGKLREAYLVLRQARRFALTGAKEDFMTNEVEDGLIVLDQFRSQVEARAHRRPLPRRQQPLWKSSSSPTACRRPLSTAAECRAPSCRTSCSSMTPLVQT